MLSPQERKEIFAKANAIITGDHFVYAQKPDGWYHGSEYVNKDAIYPYEEYVSALCAGIAEHFANAGIETVVGPTVGGVALVQWTTHWLKRLPHVGYQKIMAVCADEEDVLGQKELRDDELRKMGHVINLQAVGSVQIELWEHDLKFRRVSFSTKVGTRRIIKRGYDKHVKGKRCLIVEDIVNSGATVAKTRDAILAAGGEVIGVGCLCNRSGGKVTAATLCVLELFSLLDVDMKMFKEDELGYCHICRQIGRGSVRLDLGKGKEFLSRLGLKPGDK